MMTRSKEANDARECINVRQLPSFVFNLDYRLRRRKCLACGALFSTVETYFEKDDIDSYMSNEFDGLL